MEIIDFLAIGVVGVGLKYLVDALKAKYGTKSVKTKGLTIVLALVVGAGYVALRDTSYWATVVLILMTASTVYAFLRK